jgi:hypothetical protein
LPVILIIVADWDVPPAKDQGLLFDILSLGIMLILKSEGGG